MTQNTVTESFPFRLMIDLHAALNDVARRYEPMPDDAMDYINDAIGVVSEAIIAAPVTSESDIAHKFRFAAVLIEDESGLLFDEPHAVFGAMANLAKFRDKEWRSLTGRPCPWYGEYAR